MILVDAVALTENGQFYIPSYHRGHLSLRSNTEVTVGLLPPTENAFVPGMRELVISPILFESWQHLVRITALFCDVPGVVRNLAEAVKSEKLDVMYEESATIENGRYHRVELLASATLLYSDHRYHSADEPHVLPRLERRLIALCLDELVLTGGVPRLKVRPMEGLRNAWRSIVDQRRGAFRPSVPHPIRAVIRDRKVQTPQEILNAIEQPIPRVVLVSDTRDRILRALVPSRDVGFTYVKVEHLDQIGSLFKIADALSRGFTAVLTLTRLKRQGTRNDVEFLLHSADYPTPSGDDEDQRRKLVSTLLADQRLGDLSPSVSYPRRAGEPEHASNPPIAFEIPLPQERGIARLGLQTLHSSTQEILQKKLDRYVDPNFRSSLPWHRQLKTVARRLLNAEGAYPLPYPQVFISYNFEREDLFATVAKVLSEEPYVRIATGRDPDGKGSPFRMEILKRIKASQGIIAIWGADADLPWLLWELGAAQAFGLPVMILPHVNLKDSPHLKILPEVHHQSFKDMDLRDAFIARWNTFREEVARFDREASK